MADRELKFFETEKALTTSSTTGVLLDDSLLHIPQNTTENGRLGRRIQLVHLAIRGHMLFNSTTTLSQMNNALRVIVFLDKQANGAAATMSDIISSDGVVDFLSFRDLSNSGRFRILHDQALAMNGHAVLQSSASVGDNLPRTYLWGLNVPLHEIIEYSGTTGAMTEIRSSNIGVMTVCHEALVLPHVAYRTRVRYFDT